MISTTGQEGWQLTDEQLAAGLVEAFELKAKIEAECARLAAMAMERDLPRVLGHSSIRTLISNTTKVSTYEAARTVRRAEAFGPDTEMTQEAWAAGEPSGERFQVIATAVANLPDWAHAEKSVAEQQMLGFAREFGLDDLKRLANHVIEVIDPDGAEEHVGKDLQAQEAKALRDTTLEMFHAGDGMTRGHFLIPTAQAAGGACLSAASGAPHLGPRRRIRRCGRRTPAPPAEARPGVPRTAGTPPERRHVATGWPRRVGDDQHRPREAQDRHRYRGPLGREVIPPRGIDPA